ncbi:efflux RND transporter periplasmic adaptor subunit [Rheinheimera soli]|uniref:efflux RND transporter periplasmic adaptor subunit n=1 Tax=Rheinheimera soli TaxID=443616 RepID=UPI001E5944B1|nr:efflux RND transporter periplasmic adaptor subunit [Rheinheimera soli]
MSRQKMIYAVLVMGLVAGCSKPVATAEQSLNRPVKLHLVQDGQQKLIRQFPALVEPTENARLTFRVSGKLTQFSIRPGQEVQKGDVLARLDPTDFKLRVEQAQAKYQLSKAQFDRAASLIGQNLVSQAMYDEAKAQLQVADADLKTAQANLSYTELVAPFSGIVSRSLVENHENVAAQQAILELQLKGMVDVVIQVPEDVIALVKKDISYQPEVIFDSYPSLSYKASIKEWDTRADSATNSFKVVFSMAAPEEFNVLSGMTANVVADMSQLMRAQASAVVVPATAVFAANDQPVDATERFVWVFSEGKVNRRAVTVGRLTEQGIEVLSGLVAGDQVVTAGVQQLTENQQVRPWQRERGL